jgi:Zonular occludens toxin (Zot)
MTDYHTGYYGITQSGKTTVARFVARALAKAKHQIVVYDPMRTATRGGDWPDSAIVYLQREQFLRDVGNMQNAQLFIDEADDIFSHEQKENFWIMTRGRHQGLYTHLITQRPNRVHPTARSQCTRAYLCKLNKSDRQAVLADHGHEDIDINHLHGSFILVDNRTHDVVFGNAFTL